MIRRFLNCWSLQWQSSWINNHAKYGGLQWYQKGCCQNASVLRPGHPDCVCLSRYWQEHRLSSTFAVWEDWTVVPEVPRNKGGRPPILDTWDLSVSLSILSTRNFSWGWPKLIIVFGRIDGITMRLLSWWVTRTDQIWVWKECISINCQSSASKVGIDSKIGTSAWWLCSEISFRLTQTDHKVCVRTRWGQTCSVYGTDRRALHQRAASSVRRMLPGCKNSYAEVRIYEGRNKNILPATFPQGQSVGHVPLCANRQKTNCIA